MRTLRVRPDGVPTVPGATIAGVVAGTIALACAAAPARAFDRLPVDTLNVESTRTGDNSYEVKFETRLPAGWTARAGMDMSLGRTGETTFTPQSIAAVTPQAESNTVAWSTLTLPAPSWLLGGEATLRAQLDPQASTAAVSGSVTRTRALGSFLSASLVSDLVMTETGIGTMSDVRTWEANRSVRFDVKPTGTALIAGGRIVGGPETDLNTYLTAEQPLPGGLDVTTSLGEIETGAPVLSVGARFSRSW